MPNTLALFALFVGAFACSADDVCSMSGDTSIIGKCNSGTCEKIKCPNPANPLAPKCGHTTDATLQGYCSVAGGDCKLGTSVQVNYLIRVPDTERPDYAKLIRETEFQTTFDSKIVLHNAGDAPRVCPSGHGDAPSPKPAPTEGNPQLDSTTVTNGKLTCNVGYKLFGGEPCKLNCNSTYTTTKKEETYCKIDGSWEKNSGSCALACPKKLTEAGTEGALTEDPSTEKSILTYVGASPAKGAATAEGDLTCTEIFKNAPAKCTLSCPPGYRVQTQSTYKCNNDSSPKWGGNRGVCKPSDDLYATVKVILPQTYDVVKVKAEKSDAFNNKFKEAVADALGGKIFPENVDIVDIGDPNRRRLNEKYDNVDSTDSPEDDGRGGLRGIR